MSAATEPAKRIVGLDVLRFLAVALVFIRHHHKPEVCPAWWRAAYDVLALGGRIGVDLFFVLSGFLVSGLFFGEWQKRQQVSVSRFLIRRGLKIYPAFIAFMLYTCIYMAFAGLPRDFRVRHAIGELLFLQNYLGSIWPHNWSLAVEEHFYLLLAFCVWFFLKRTSKAADPFRFIIPLFGWIAVGCLSARIGSYLLFPHYDGRLISYATHVRMDSLMFGVLLSYLWHFHTSATAHENLRRCRYLLVVGGVLLMLPAFMYDYHEHRWVLIFGFNLFYLGGGCLLLGSLKVFDGKNSALLRGIAWLGTFSYSTYLWHVLAMYWAQVLVGKFVEPANFWWVYTPVAFGTVWLVGVITAKLVEFPVLRLRDRFFPSPAKAV